MSLGLREIDDQIKKRSKTQTRQTINKEHELMEQR